MRNALSAQDLRWVKNVKRDNGTAWAYMEYDVGDIFYLHFPDNEKWYPTNYSKPRIGDCILIYQTLNDNIISPGGIYITHIVTPLNENVERDLNSTHPYKRLVMVIGRSPQGIYRPTEWNFFKANRGQICKIETLELSNRTQPGISVVQNYFWNLFQNIDASLIDLVNNSSIELPDEELLTAEEGREREFLKMHKQRERSSMLVALKKERAALSNSLYCEVCDFDFASRYPNLGRGFIECHHKQPIARGVRITSLDDLSLVCSNCHRMLHRKNQHNVYYSVDELRQLYNHP